MDAKRILISGGASGLGRAIALRFANEGFRVCIIDLNVERGIDTEEQLQQLSPESFFHQASVTEELDWKNVRELLLQRWGGIDVLVNNAGIAGTPGGVGEISIEDWLDIIDINLLGVVRGCKTFHPIFQQQKQGYVINIASAAGLMNAPMMSAYNATKAGVISLSETLHTELSPYGVGVSVVCPGFFRTNLTESLKSENQKTVDFVNRLMDASKISAEDVADMIFVAHIKRQFLVLPHKEVTLSWRIKRFFPALFRYLMVRQTRSLLAGAVGDQKGVNQR